MDSRKHRHSHRYVSIYAVGIASLVVQIIEASIIYGYMYTYRNTGAYYGWKYVKELIRPTFPGEKKRVVVLGTGWAALSLINHLAPEQFDVTVVSPRNYFLFTPLLPSVTVGTVESRSIVEPFRKLMKKHHKASCLVRTFT